MNDEEHLESEFYYPGEEEQAKIQYLVQYGNVFIVIFIHKKPYNDY